ncbi:MAG: hypothetical protein FRX49_13591 [Trebouxia sp. A1-2]|nr:MAG: hypothetical protein FRX49_13591 [Trebouxia sp. A1-2]
MFGVNQPTTGQTHLEAKHLQHNALVRASPRLALDRGFESHVTYLANSPTKPLDPMRCTVSLANFAAASGSVPGAHSVAKPLKICPSRISWIFCRASSARAESGKAAATRRMA